MKRLVAGITGCAAIALMWCGCESQLLYQDEIPQFKAPADRALCVVIRPMAFTGDEIVNIFCDTKYVGATEGNTVLSFEVMPGEHYIIGDGTNKSKVKFNFQAGKVYFISHTVVTVSPGGGSTNAYSSGGGVYSSGPSVGAFGGGGSFIKIRISTFKPMTGSDAMAKIDSERGKCKWVQPNPNDPQDDLKADDLDDVKKDWDEWAKEVKNAEDLKAETEYPGY